MTTESNLPEKKEPLVEPGEMSKGVPHIIVEIVEYVPHAVVCKTIINKSTGKVSAFSFDKGEEFCEKTIAQDTYVQIIDGMAEITINSKLFTLPLGSSIVIPAHALHCFQANVQFKMLTTIIMSSYED